MGKKQSSQQTEEVVSLKAYACLEPYENTGGIVFAKSNIEARRRSADEYHDGDIGGMSVKRAPWADKYGAAHKVPILDMTDHGWRFECQLTGVIIESDIYENGTYRYDETLKEDVFDSFLIGKSPVGNQYGDCFACQEYADEYYEIKRQRKEFEKEQLDFYKEMLFSRFPDAILVNDEIHGNKEHIYSIANNVISKAGTPFIVQEFRIPFKFPSGNHLAHFEMRREYYGWESHGPIKPFYTCAKADLEVFEKWSEEQKELIL